jgi:AbiV family abortive infection protein
LKTADEQSDAQTILKNFLKKPEVAQSETPSIAQLWIAIGLSVLHAKEQIETAQLLHEHKKMGPAFTHSVMCIEELGKIALYSKCLKIPKDERDAAWSKNSKKLYSHTEKISAFCNAFEALQAKHNQSSAWSFIFTLKTENDLTSELVKKIISFHEAGILDKVLHSIRLEVSYSGFVNGRVISPARAAMELNPDLLEMTIEMIKVATLSLEKALKFFNPLYEQIFILYRSTDTGSEQLNYSKIEKTLNRIVPSAIQILSQFVQESIGLDLADSKHHGEISKKLSVMPLKNNLFKAFEEILKMAANDSVIDPKVLKLLAESDHDGAK